MKYVRISILVAIAALCVLLSSMGFRLLRDLQDLSTANGQNLRWTIVQLDTETARLHSELLEASLAEETDTEAIALRVNIALSRIGLVRRGNARATFAEADNAIALLDSLDRYATEMIALLDAEPGVSEETIAEMLALTTAIRPDARRLAIVGNSISARQAEARRLALAAQLRLTGIVAMAVIAALTAALIVLDRLLRVADQRGRDLRASGARLSSTIAASLDAIVTTDAEGVITGFNEAAEAMFKWNASDIVGQRIDATLNPTPVQADSKMDPPELSGTCGSGRIEIAARRHTNETFPAEMNVSVLGPEAGGMKIYYFRDISEQKIAATRLILARDRAERMDHAKTRFLEIMSHEMRTPLNGILGLLDLMRSKNLTPEQDRYAEVAIGSAELLLQQANDALDVTRIEAGSLALSDVEFRLSDTLRDTVELLSPLANRKGLDLVLRIDPDMNTLFRGDEDRIRQIATNLIGNGIKFTATGAITVELSGIHGQESSDIRLVVSDTGPGIPEAQQDAIFEDYVVLAKSSGRDKRGDGLGLSISRRIARLMDGDLSVQSTPGQGSMFVFSAPLERSLSTDAAESTMQDTRTAVKFAKHQKHVLVVEDNSVSQSVLSEMLELMGHRVTLASNGQEACNHAAAERFDLIIMDISMPVMDGLEATRHIRGGSGANRTTPILGLTAHGPQEFRDRTKEAGMSCFATKPLRFGKLQDLLEAIDRRPPEASKALDELVATLGLERVIEIADKLRREIADTVAQLAKDKNPQRNSELADQFHKLQGAASLLGFCNISAQLEGLRDRCSKNEEYAAPEDVAALTRDLKRVSEEYSNKLGAFQIA